MIGYVGAIEYALINMTVDNDACNGWSDLRQESSRGDKIFVHLILSGMLYILSKYKKTDTVSRAKIDIVCRIFLLVELSQKCLRRNEAEACGE